MALQYETRNIIILDKVGICLGHDSLGAEKVVFIDFVHMEVAEEVVGERRCI
jgi:hypothetical protein